MIAKIDEMNKDDKDIALLSVGSMFETGKVESMFSISELYPTKISTLLRMNHGRYVAKLNHPETFTFDEITRLATLLKIDPESIAKVIFNELRTRK